MEKYFDDDEDVYDSIELTGESGEKIEFLIIDAIVVDNIKYLLVIPADEADEDEPEATIIKEEKSEENDVFYSFVMDDNEFNKVSVLLQDNEGDYEMEF